MQNNDEFEKPLDETIEEVINGMLTSELHTITIGVVDSFDKTKQVASIQPVIKRRFANLEEPVALPLLDEVPVHFFGSGNYVETVNVAKGSFVILLIAERSIENWFDTGNVVDPESSRKFDLSDAIALAGLNPKPNFLNTVEDGIGFRNIEGSQEIQLDENGVRLIAELVKLGEKTGGLPLLKVSTSINTAWDKYFNTESAQQTLNASAFTTLVSSVPTGSASFTLLATQATVLATNASSMVGALNANKTTKVVAT